MRPDGRNPADIRPLTMQAGFTSQPAGSVLVRCGQTLVLCTASVENSVPRFRLGQGGWLTAEYGMLPGSTHERSPREAAKGKQSGRTVEIQRLIGRCLRTSVDMQLLGDRTVTIDCEVLQADGGTRTASITGGFVALALAMDRLLVSGELAASPMICGVSAISAGIVGGAAVVDLPYVEDSAAEVDGNFVRTSRGEWVEVQASGEGGVLRRSQLDELMDLSDQALDVIWGLQKQTLGEEACARLGLV
jgi:ribonuclease PH